MKRAAKFLETRIPKRELTIVDVGHWGNPKPLRILNEKLPGKKKLVGVNDKPIAKEIKKKFPDKVDFKQGMAEKLPLEDNSVDIIINHKFWNSYMKNHVSADELGEHFSEVHRVLKKDGHYVVAEYFAGNVAETPESAKKLLEKYHFKVIHLDRKLLIAKPA